jgi:hypothetical protein
MAYDDFTPISSVGAIRGKETVRQAKICLHNPLKLSIICHSCYYCPVLTLEETLEILLR